MNTQHTPGPWATDAGIIWSTTAKDSKGRAKLVCRGSRANCKRIVDLQNQNAELLAALRALADDADRHASALRALADDADRHASALRALADEADRHASHPVSDHKPYFSTMAARARAAIAKVQS